MKLDPLQSLQTQLARGASSLSFAGGGDLASKLTLGQIIKGRVLRSYEGGRHLVDFDGQQKVVDSAVPLRADEILYGRVVGLADKVELHRVPGPGAAPAPTGAPAGAPALTVAAGDRVASILERYQAQLSPSARNLLQRTMARAAVPEHMALSGLILSKLGIPLSAAALGAVFEVLQRDRSQSLFALPERAIELLTRRSDDTGAAPVSPPVQADESLERPATVAALAALIAEGLDADADLSAGRLRPETGTPLLAERLPSGYRRSHTRDQGQRGAPDPDVVRQIFNVQTGGAVAHRVGTLPLLVDGRLLELDIALFDQTAEDQPQTASGLTHRQVVFSVSTAALGRVEIQAASAGSHMRLRLSTDARESAQYLAGHAGRLTADLERLGWQIDELAYRAVPPGAPGAVVQAVLEHLVAPGSVSELA